MRCLAKSKDTYLLEDETDFNKNCCNQVNCCDECGYEDCHEGCDLFDKLGSCDRCEFAEVQVLDIIKSYPLRTLAIYLHSWQGENMQVEEIINLLEQPANRYKNNQV